MVLKHKLTENLLALNGAHIARYLFPLITVSYLTRRLGVEVWGLVAFAQAFGVLVSLLVEYGFNLTATREVARNQEDAESHADLLAGVLGVQMVLGFSYAAILYLKKMDPYGIAVSQTELDLN